MGRGGRSVWGDPGQAAVSQEGWGGVPVRLGGPGHAGGSQSGWGVPVSIGGLRQAGGVLVRLGGPAKAGGVPPQA